MNVTFKSLISKLSEPSNIQSLNGITRGIERECLRVNEAGGLSQNSHPAAFGSALSHQHITTDYSESLLEFITPVSDSAAKAQQQLSDIHRNVVKNLDGELFWPSSMPCQICDAESIPLAKYGTSNTGKMKHTYRIGLKHRYGSSMQIISGLHYNVSLPITFWQTLYDLKGEIGELQDFISDSYMGLIRNFYRHGWLVPYLFGASPALNRSFLPTEKQTPFSTLGEDTLYMPYATSLRMSDLGYTNNAQDDLVICHNTLENYTDSLKKAIKTKAPEFANIGIKVDGEYRQLNDNVLQIENELYAPIRPKRVAKSNEKPSEALAARGIEYIEIRSLDVNPFVATGITTAQMSVLDSLLVWMALQPSAPMTAEEMAICRDNSTKVVMEGRKPGLTLQFDGKEQVLADVAGQILTEVQLVAGLLDGAQLATETAASNFSQAVAEQQALINRPESLLSGQVLAAMKAQGLEHNDFILNLAKKYKAELLATDYAHWDDTYFNNMQQQSVAQQQKIEAEDTLDFDAFLSEYFATTKNR
ncbi:Glutamate--cysteine ligase [Moritella sp. JT01]|uniref:glutamate--cysteine ligase n=1 Tax=Moritella sp. JT01 TaxID=756698 RepID=UPI00079BD584|nr:glutamate--cysteine ligase [Moritella sp. JT01]KXO13520.1 Glutamate--cysteine ligase [Moritella sp. JT01]